ncbi:hypothetical protein [[Actinomadura] parvosata]|uniref:hypothetical protein n=1 Tax=[Actinomadura] parvosata TaxID=1955412 RepID=UPI0012BD1F3B|nr:hypothetical protein [Nonomuraea sp. ATCC 55076]
MRLASIHSLLKQDHIGRIVLTIARKWPTSKATRLERAYSMATRHARLVSFYSSNIRNMPDDLRDKVRRKAVSATCRRAIYWMISPRLMFAIASTATFAIAAFGIGVAASIESFRPTTHRAALTATAFVFMIPITLFATSAFRVLRRHDLNETSFTMVTPTARHEGQIALAISYLLALYQISAAAFEFPSFISIVPDMATFAAWAIIFVLMAPLISTFYAVRYYFVRRRYPRPSGLDLVMLRLLTITYWIDWCRDPRRQDPPPIAPQGDRSNGRKNAHGGGNQAPSKQRADSRPWANGNYIRLLVAELERAAQDAEKFALQHVPYRDTATRRKAQILGLRFAEAIRSHKEALVRTAKVEDLAATEESLILGLEAWTKGDLETLLAAVPDAEVKRKWQPVLGRLWPAAILCAGAFAIPALPLFSNAPEAASSARITLLIAAVLAVLSGGITPSERINSVVDKIFPATKA